MAAIRRYGKGTRWRAEVYRQGHRRSATFDTEAEARQWADQVENLIDGALLGPDAAFQKIEEAARTKQSYRPVFLTPKTLDEMGLPDKAEIIAAASPVPKTLSGVYFLIEDDEIVYVGQSGNVIARLQTHLLTKKFNKIAILPCEEKERATIEAKYIHLFQPKLNDFVLGRDIKPDDTRRLTNLPIFLSRRKKKPRG